MHQIKEMLEKMGFKVAMKDGIYYRIDDTVDSYGGEPSNISVKEVTPKEVTKVEHI